MVPLFCPVQGLVEVATVGPFPVEWEEVWDSWVAPEDLEVDSLVDDPLLVHQRQMLDHITLLDLAA